MNRRLILLLGEGNFSFARFLANQLATSSIADSTDLVATDFVNNKIDNEDDKTQHCDVLSFLLQQFSLDESIQENIRELNSREVPIWLDVDSTRLEFHERLHQVLSSGKYSSFIVVFNFAHVHNIKMKINLNRDLLRQTFSSIEALLHRHSQLKSTASVYISLCYGQSGLNEVEPEDRRRSWADSWQLTEMAAAGNFVLTNVMPFGPELIDTLTGDILNSLRRQFEHNCKCFFVGINENEHGDFHSSEHQEKASIHQSFGYRLQNRPFNQPTLYNQFRGGNVFQFEHRGDIFDSLDCPESDLFTNPIVRQFICSIERLLHAQLPDATITPIHDSACPFNHCLGIDRILSKDIESTLHEIGKYLSTDLSTGQHSITNDGLFLGNIKCAALESDKLKLNIEACLAVRFKLKKPRILCSEYLVEMENPVKGQKPATIFSTRALYSRLYNRDVSFWVEKTSNLQADEVVDIKWEFARIAWKFLGPSLVSLNLKDHYIKSSLVSSYCFALQIQSLDQALNRWKVAEMVKRLQERVLVEIANVRLR